MPVSIEKRDKSQPASTIPIGAVSMVSADEAENTRPMMATGIRSWRTVTLIVDIEPLATPDPANTVATAHNGRSTINTTKQQGINRA